MDVGIFNPDSTNFQAYSTDPITVTAGYHRLTFRGIATPGDHTSYIDQVAIALVPDGSNRLQMTLAVEHGTISLGTAQGLTFMSGDGSDDATMTFQGTMADINAALEGLRYTPSNDFVGSDTLRITTNDLGNRGHGGPQITVNTVNINVAGGPVVNSTISGTQQTFPESPQSVAANANGNYVVVWSARTRTETAGASMPGGSMRPASPRETSSRSIPKRRTIKCTPPSP